VMIKSTCIRPNERVVKIKSLHAMLDFNRNEYMKAFGMEVAKDMTVVPARVLPAPQVQYKGNVSVTPQYGGWQVRTKRRPENEMFICIVRLR